MFLISLLLWQLLCRNAEALMVQVEQGFLKGEILSRSTGNGLYCSFKGIPYAAPPVGDLRFKTPQPPQPWKDMRKATEFGPICPQVEPDTGKLVGEEDCLFLNVYTPTMTPVTPLPVMFFIHGGNLVSGSGNNDWYGPDFLLDQNVVVVTINYRLGALGFLCLDSKDVPGNAGLKDQVAALRWVKKNINKFGGNPKNVTIFGQCSGGTSVSLHALSPLSKGLFNRAIAMSGVFLMDFAKPCEPTRQAFLLAHKIGLYTKNPDEAFKFLQNASVEAIVTKKPDILAYDKLLDIVTKIHTYPPVVEKDFGDEHFMTDDPETLLLDGKTNGIDLILGHTSEEGITDAISQKDHAFKIFPYYPETLVPPKMYQKINPKKALEVSDRIRQHYFGHKDICEENMKEFIRFYTFLIYDYNIHRYLEMWTNAGNKAYFYEFDYFSERNKYGEAGVKYGIQKAGHYDDLLYVFDGKKYNLTVNKEKPSYKVIVHTCKLLTNFAKYGNPTPDKSLGPMWIEYNKNQSCLHIDEKLTLREMEDKVEIDFWRKIFKCVGIKFS